MFLQDCFAFAESFSFPYEFQGKFVNFCKKRKKRVVDILVGKEKKKEERERKRQISEWLLGMGKKENTGDGYSEH